MQSVTGGKHSTLLPKYEIFIRIKLKQYGWESGGERCGRSDVSLGGE